MSDIPQHIGLVLDGNRRWAVENGLTSFEGHREGYETLKTVVDVAFSRGVKYVSAYVFSTENWSRSEDEVAYLLELVLYIFKWDLKKFHKKGIRMRWFGTIERLGPKYIKAFKDAEELTKNNTKGDFCICFNYGGQQEIVDAAKKLISTGMKPEDITVDTFSEALYCPNVPPIDIMVRSSGEMRISNFMLWRIAYAEFMFIDKHWPAFTESDIDNIITEYNLRHRRFGK